MFVEAVEVDAALGEAYGGGHAAGLAMLDVGDGDASAEACGAAAFAVQDLGDEFIAQGLIADARGDECVDEFVDDAAATGEPLIKP